MVNNRTEHVERIYAALGDPTRRDMVERLRLGSMSISELGAPLGMTLAGVGKHVMILETAGIIVTAKSGRVRQCALAPGGLDAAAAWIDEIRGFWNDSLDRLAGRLEAEQQ